MHQCLLCLCLFTEILVVVAHAIAAGDLQCQNVGVYRPRVQGISERMHSGSCCSAALHSTFRLRSQ